MKNLWIIQIIRVIISSKHLPHNATSALPHTRTQIKKRTQIIKKMTILKRSYGVCDYHVKSKYAKLVAWKTLSFGLWPIALWSSNIDLVKSAPVKFLQWAHRYHTYLISHLNRGETDHNADCILLTSHQGSRSDLIKQSTDFEMQREWSWSFLWSFLNSSSTILSFLITNRKNSEIQKQIWSVWNKIVKNAVWSSNSQYWKLWCEKPNQIISKVLYTINQREKAQKIS